jgi:ABC-type uncharacterized transport system YnjBCD substrate-binding protein
MNRCIAPSLATLLVATGFASPTRAETLLQVVTAGDVNMVDYVKDHLGPLFEKSHPGVRVVSVGTGPGDAGSQTIYEKLSAEKAAGAATWDFDVLVIHQKMAGQMVREGYLEKYRERIATGGLATRDSVRNSLGTNVEGYVMPMFHSQTAIAYNPELVENVPGSYAELAEWVKKHPKQFGWNGIKGGMSGVAFAVGWISAFGGHADQLIAGPYDKSIEAAWETPLAALKAFNRDVVITPGNAGTLDQLNRGEIAMGPVWVDMFYSWMADGKLPPTTKLKLIAPGMPGQPMYYAVPVKAAQKALAEEFIALATSPEVQAKGIVERFNWYPGIDASHLQGRVSDAAWAKLFGDIPPATLAEAGKPFPIAPYFNDVLEAYEKKVAN